MTQFVAEFTTNHMGNLNLLLRMVERAAWSGCDAIKMQKKDVKSFYTREKLTADYCSPYGKTYGEYRELFEFGEEDFARFDRKCKEYGVEWFCTAQDIPSLMFLLRFDLARYKVASCNARNHDLLHEFANNIPFDRTIVMSVAGLTLKEVERSLAIFPNHPIWLLHCVAQYPCPPDALRLGNVRALRQHFGSERVTVGYSGHEEGLDGTYGAIAMGAEVVERHFCLSRHSFVHHIECSLEPEEFKELVDTVHAGRQSTRQYRSLGPKSFTTSFGMTPVEHNFLVEQSYGNKYVGHASWLNGRGTSGSGDDRAVRVVGGKAV